MKKVLSFVLALAMMFSLAASAQGEAMLPEPDNAESEIKTITLRTGPAKSPSFENGNLTVNWSPDREYVMKVPLSLDGYTASAEFRFTNVQVDLVLSTAGAVQDLSEMVSRTVMSAANPSALFINPNLFLDPVRAVQEMHVRFDLSYQFSFHRMQMLSPASPRWSTVGELEIKFPRGLPLGPSGFELNPFGMMQFTYLQDNELSFGVNGSHFEMDFSSGTQNLTGNLVPGEQFTNTEELDSNEFALNFGVALDWAHVFTVAEILTGVTWKEDITKAVHEDYRGTASCREVEWLVQRRSQFTFNPGIDFNAGTGSIAKVNAYFQMEQQVNEHWVAGVTIGSVTSAYLTVEFGRQTIDWPLNVGNSTVQSGETAHFEQIADTRYGWERVDACTRKAHIAFDTGIPGDEPLVIDCSSIKGWEGNKWNELYWRPRWNSLTFQGWYTEDGVDFFRNLSTLVYPQPQWEGTLVLTARWEDETPQPHEPATITYGMGGYTTTADGKKATDVWGTGLSNAASWYDNAYSNFSYEQLRSYGMIGDMSESTAADRVRVMADLRNEYFSRPYIWVYNNVNSPLTSVVFGDKVLGTNGYNGAHGLESVYCSDTMADIGTYYDCISLRSVRLPVGLKNLQDIAFNSCSSLQEITLPDSLTDLGRNTFSRSGLRSVVIPEGVTELKEMVFENCKNLTSVTFPSHLDKIGSYAFRGCTALQSIEINAAEIMASAFEETTGLKTALLTGESLKFDGSDGPLFSYSGIESLTIDVDNLTDGVWIKDANNLKTLTIRASAIGGEVRVDSCPSLETINIECVNCAGLTVTRCDGLQSIRVDNSGLLHSLEVGDCDLLESIQISGKVRRSGIYSLPNLTELDIDLMETDGEGDAFTINYVSRIKTVEVPEGVTVLGANSIVNCGSLVCVTVPAYTAVDPNAVVSSDPVVYAPQIQRRIATGLSTIPAGSGYPLHFTSAFGPINSDWTLAAGESIQLFAPEKYGMTFRCWYPDDDRSAPLSAGQTFVMPDHETTLFAEFQTDSLYNYTTDDNGMLLWYGWNSRDAIGQTHALPDWITKLNNGCIEEWETGVYISRNVTYIDPLSFSRALALQSIRVDPANPYYYDIDGVLYSRDGALISVPQAYPGDTLELPHGLTAIGSYAFYCEDASHLTALLIPDSVTDVGDHWNYGLSQGCAIYGPETGPVAQSAKSGGLRYNVFPLYLLSHGECIAMLTVSAGDALPDLNALEGEGFLGWSLTPNGDIINGPVQIPFGGLEVYAVWDTESIPIDAERFPDAAFRAYISEQWDQNSDGQLSEDEIFSAQVFWLSVRDNHIQDGFISAEDAEYINSHYRDRIASLQGIEYFTNLKDIMADPMTALSGTLNLSRNKELRNVYVGGANLTGLVPGALHNLRKLVCHESAVSSLDVRGCTALDTLVCENSALTALDLSGLASLQELWCAGNALTNLDLAGCSALKYLHCADNALTVLDLEDCVALEQAAVHRNQLTGLNLAGHNCLTELHADWNRIEELNVSSCPNLKLLYFGDNLVTSLDVSGSPALEVLVCWGNRLTSLDLSRNSAIRELIAENNVYPVTPDGCFFDTAVLEGFVPENVTDWFGAPTCGGKVLFDQAGDLRYTYDCGSGHSVLFTLRADRGPSTMSLPAAMTAIEEEAFSSTDAELYLLPSGPLTIGSGAFSNLRKTAVIFIPARDVTIADDAFAGSSVVFVCPPDSAAYSWAAAHHIPVAE